MSQLPSVELLESTHAFPCAYVLKAIGAADGGFVARVVAAARAELAADADPPYSVRQTPGGRHVAVTLTPHMASAEQVRALYRAVAQTEGLVMLM